MASDSANYSVDELIALCYGVRTRLADLQSAQQSSNRSPELLRQIERANSEVARIDHVVVEMVRQDPVFGRQFFEQIKATHIGSIQKLSQTVKNSLVEVGIV